MTQLNGEPLDFAKSGPFIISNHGCYKDILTIINRNGVSYLIILIVAFMKSYFLRRIES